MVGFLLLVYLAVAVLWIAGQWKAFTKAGKPGWACLIPIYVAVVMLEIAEKPMWWLVVILLVPIANIIFLFMLHMALAENTGRAAALASA